jgi:hypothetical protein
MKSVYSIFDSFKTAFHINKENKELYRPQVILIVIKSIMMVGVGVGLYWWIGKEGLLELLSGEVTFLRFALKVLSVGIGLLTMITAYVLLSRMVEAGLYNLYKKSVAGIVLERKDFWEGIRKYFLNFLFGDLLILAAWVVISPIYFIAGAVTLTIGFAVIPMAINIFLTMWKVSLVMNDSTLFASIGDSFKFAKRNFFPLAVLQLIHWSFMKLGGGSGNTLSWTRNVDKVSNIDKLPPTVHSDMFSGHQNMLGNGEPFTLDTLKNVIGIVRMIIAVLIPVVTIAVAVSSLVKMIFEVFFTLAIFVVYRDDFGQSEEVTESEAIL